MQTGPRLFAVPDGAKLSDEPLKVKLDNNRITRHTERQMIKKAVQRCEFDDLDLQIFYNKTA